MCQNNIISNKSVVQNFEKLCHLGLCSHLQAYVVTISHLDTWLWLTLIVLTINILTLLPYTSFNCYHKYGNYVNHDPAEAEELELIKVRSKINIILYIIFCLKSEKNTNA